MTVTLLQFESRDLPKMFAKRSCIGSCTCVELTGYFKRLRRRKEEYWVLNRALICTLKTPNTQVRFSWTFILDDCCSFSRFFQRLHQKALKVFISRKSQKHYTVYMTLRLEVFEIMSIILSVQDLFWVNFFQNFETVHKWTIQGKWTPQIRLAIVELIFELHEIRKWI